jgi:hypothetical protein
MNDYIKLSAVPDQDNHVDFLLNKNKRNYLNLLGINPPEVIKCVRDFLVKYRVWAATDVIVQTKKHKNFIPDQSAYHDISFMITFYDLACIGKEVRERKATEEIQQPPTEEYQPTEPPTEIPAETYQHIVKYLTRTPVAPETNLARKDQLLEELRNIIIASKTKNELSCPHRLNSIEEQGVLLEASEEVRVIPETPTKCKKALPIIELKKASTSSESKVSISDSSSEEPPPKKPIKPKKVSSSESSEPPKKITKPVIKKPPAKPVKASSESVESDSGNDLDESSEANSVTPVKRPPPKRPAAKTNIKVVAKRPPAKKTK